MSKKEKKHMSARCQFLMNPPVATVMTRAPWSSMNFVQRQPMMNLPPFYHMIPFPPQLAGCPPMFMPPHAHHRGCSCDGGNMPEKHVNSGMKREEKQERQERQERQDVETSTSGQFDADDAFMKFRKNAKIHGIDIKPTNPKPDSVASHAGQSAAEESAAGVADEEVEPHGLDSEKTEQTDVTPDKDVDVFSAEEDEGNSEEDASVPPATGGTTALEDDLDMKNQVSNLCIDDQIPKPCVDNQIPEPCMDSQVSKPCIDNQIPKLCNDDQIPKPCMDSHVSKPCIDNQVPKPCIDNQISKPCMDNQIPKPCIDNPIPKPCMDSQISKPCVDNQIPEPCLDSKIPKPCVDNQIPKPSMDSQLSKPCIDDQLLEPCVDNQIPKPCIDNQISKPCVDFQRPKPCMDNQVPKLCMHNQIPRLSIDNLMPRLGRDTKIPKSCFDCQRPKPWMDNQGPKLYFSNKIPRLGFDDQMFKPCIDNLIPRLGSDSQVPKSCIDCQIPKPCMDNQGPKLCLNNQIPRLGIEDQISKPCNDNVMPKLGSDSQVPVLFGDNQVPKLCNDSQIPKSCVNNQMPDAGYPADDVSLPRALVARKITADVQDQTGMDEPEVFVAAGESDENPSVVACCACAKTSSMINSWTQTEKERLSEEKQAILVMCDVSTSTLDLMITADRETNTAANDVIGSMEGVVEDTQKKPLTESSYGTSPPEFAFRTTGVSGFEAGEDSSQEDSQNIFPFTSVKTISQKSEKFWPHIKEKSHNSTRTRSSSAMTESTSSYAAEVVGAGREASVGKEYMDFMEEPTDLKAKVDHYLNSLVEVSSQSSQHSHAKNDACANSPPATCNHGSGFDQKPDLRYVTGVPRSMTNKNSMHSGPTSVCEELNDLSHFGSPPGSLANAFNMDLYTRGSPAQVSSSPLCDVTKSSNNSQDFGRNSCVHDACLCGTSKDSVKESNLRGSKTTSFRNEPITDSEGSTVEETKSAVSERNTHGKESCGLLSNDTMFTASGNANQSSDSASVAENFASVMDTIKSHLIKYSPALAGNTILLESLAHQQFYLMQQEQMWIGQVMENMMKQQHQSFLHQAPFGAGLFLQPPQLAQSMMLQPRAQTLLNHQPLVHPQQLPMPHVMTQHQMMMFPQVEHPQARTVRSTTITQSPVRLSAPSSSAGTDWSQAPESVTGRESGLPQNNKVPEDSKGALGKNYVDQKPCPLNIREATAGPTLSTVPTNQALGETCHSDRRELEKNEGVVASPLSGMRKKFCETGAFPSSELRKKFCEETVNAAPSDLRKKFCEETVNAASSDLRKKFCEETVTSPSSDLRKKFCEETVSSPSSGVSKNFGDKIATSWANTWKKSPHDTTTSASSEPREKLREEHHVQEDKICSFNDGISKASQFGAQNFCFPSTAAEKCKPLQSKTIGSSVQNVETDASLNGKQETSKGFVSTAQVMNDLERKDERTSKFGPRQYAGSVASSFDRLEEDDLNRKGKSFVPKPEPSRTSWMNTFRQRGRAAQEQEEWWDEGDSSANWIKKPHHYGTGAVKSHESTRRRPRCNLLPE